MSFELEKEFIKRRQMNTDRLCFSGAWVHNGNGVFSITFNLYLSQLLLTGEEEVLEQGDPNKMPNLKHVMNPEGNSSFPSWPCSYESLKRPQAA